jgi:hypothetical protein
MKKHLLLLVALGIGSILQAQVSKTVQLNYPGNVSYFLSTTEMSTVTNLTITGPIDSIDFVTMNKMTNLQVIDISAASCTRIPIHAFYGKKTLTSISLPSTVVKIGESAFAYCGLTTMTIPTSVTSIDESAFYQCSALQSINIPSTVSVIATRLFSGCSGLLTITIPTSISSIGDGAFASCSSLTAINIPTSVTSIGGGVFTDCNGLTIISLPSSITTIGEVLFYNCKNLTTVTIPSSITSIGMSAFTNCKNLQSVTIPESVTSIGEMAFSDCSGLTTINIPSSDTLIGEAAFSGCTSLTSITIPTSVTTINTDAFESCTALKSIYALSIEPIDLSKTYSVFLLVNTSNCTLYVPQGSETSYANAIQWKDFTSIKAITQTNSPLVNTLKITVAPNPAKSSFVVKTNSLASVNVEIYNSAGSIVLSKDVVDWKKR